MADFADHNLAKLDVEKNGKLVDCLTEMYEEKRFTDITFICMSSEDQDPTRLEAHKNILAARSSVFQSMFYDDPHENETKEILLDNVDPDIFSQFLRYLYCDTVHLTETSAKSLLEICQNYKVKPLFDECIGYLETKASPDNALDLLALAFKYRSTPLCKTVCVFIDENADNVLCSNGFLKLSHFLLKYVLEGDAFCAEETEIFKRAVEWAELQAADQGKVASDGSVIRNVLGDAFNQLRLPTLSIEEFSTITRRKNYLSLEEMEDIVAFIAGNNDHDVELPCCSAMRVKPMSEVTLVRVQEIPPPPAKNSVTTKNNRGMNVHQPIGSFRFGGNCAISVPANRESINRTCRLVVMTSIDVCMTSFLCDAVMDDCIGLPNDELELSGWIECSESKYRFDFNKAAIQSGTVILYPPMVLEKQTHNVSITIRGVSFGEPCFNDSSFGTDMTGSAYGRSVCVSTKMGQPKLVTSFIFRRPFDRNIPWAAKIKEKTEDDDSDNDETGLTLHEGALGQGFSFD